MLKISNIITKLLIYGLIISFISVMYFQKVLDENIPATGFGLSYLLFYLAGMFMISAGMLGLFFESKEYPIYSKILYLVALIWISWVYLRDGNGLSPHSFFNIKSPSPYFALSIMFTTSNQERLNKINKILYLGLIALTINMAINISNIGFTFDRVLALKKLLFLINGAIWVVPVVLFSNSSNFKRTTIAYICFAFVIYASILTATRSNLVICSSVFIALLFYRRVFKKLDYLYLVVMLIIPVFLIINIFLESEYRVVLDQGVKLLEARVDDDSRSSQITEFLDQLKFDDLVLGAGTNAKWYWTAVGKYYEFLDNQWLLTAWWAGLLPTLCYFLLLIIPFAKSLFSRNEAVFVNGLVVLLWVLTCSGLGVYVSIQCDLLFYVISLSAGVCTYNLVHKEKITFNST